ncbi:hypothetical protein A2773_02415 [Candidatus Gottesmanbacteria bacterium RIFCSPHIGHO2_01_FULL_39_10]|uniref:DUF5667 domain-containing protein n=1 Tax=Candidatus Gottesmanbacteria bacterium RIFCSPHIGHO2_01_FULL_39_10 TaxID=1798375 RepID=A0A1F5ZRA3_9BACT|nr:MAG: hypothetical protein A2773_02415 [Candidatus Gottesmanbacteria bacterium RIFCSPHIGHO2_01_FULL_39_10]
MKNKYIFPTIALAVVGLVLLGSHSAFAQNTDNKYPDIIQKLAQKFNLKEDDVKAVFDAARKEKQDQMHDRFEEKLTQDVKDGKITAAQKELIINKFKDMHAQKLNEIESWKSLTPEERRAKMEAKKAELENWAKTNGINPDYLFGEHMFIHRGMKVWGHR